MSTTAPARLRQRASIILFAFEGHRNDAIATSVGLTQRPVGVWRRRWASAFQRLVEVECTMPLAKLHRAVEDVLTDEARPGAPAKFTPEQVTQIFALACEPPAMSGRPITHWTAHELADEAARRGIVALISPAQVNRYLREAALQAHKSRYWLNTTEKDSVVFPKRVDAICECYRAAPELEKDHHTHTVCVDEIMGMQALERNAPALPMIPKRCERVEFEYTRHGTLCLVGNFQVSTGELITPTLGATRTEADFASHIERTVATDAEASWVFVLDNLNLHCSKSLVSFVAESCCPGTDLGKKGRHGIRKSVATRQEFLSELSHRVRFVYTPKHSSWLNQIEAVFGVIMRKMIRRDSFTSASDLRDKVLNFIQ